MDKNLKEKIISHKIIKKENFDNTHPNILKLASLITYMLENEEFCSNDVSLYDKEKFIEEFNEVQDLISLENCDKVSDNFSEKMESFEIGIPNKLMPFLREFVFPEIKKEY
jgi:hypothetical protein